MRISLEVDWELWRWSWRWNRAVCYFLGHPRYVAAKIDSVTLLSWVTPGPRCTRCGARPPHYEEPKYTFVWSEKPFGQDELEEASHG